MTAHRSRAFCPYVLFCGFNPTAALALSQHPAHVASTQPEGFECRVVTHHAVGVGRAIGVRAQVLASRLILGHQMQQACRSGFVCFPLPRLGGRAWCPRARTTHHRAIAGPQADALGRGCFFGARSPASHRERGSGISGCDVNGRQPRCPCYLRGFAGEDIDVVNRRHYLRRAAGPRPHRRAACPGNPPKLGAWWLAPQRA